MKTKATFETPAMFQYARDYDQELLPNSLIDEIEEFIGGFVDGAPDMSSTSKRANDLAYRIETNRGKFFTH